MAWTYKIDNDALDAALGEHNIPSDAEFARRLGISPVTLWRMRDGRMTPNTRFIAGAEALFGSAQDVLDRVEVHV